MLPEDFIRSMQQQYSGQAELLLQSLELPPAVSIRRNPRFIHDEFPSFQPVPWCQTGFFLNERPSFTLDPAFHAGAYYVQESSSMFLETIWNWHVPKEQPLTVLDLCAAPGGKSTHLLSLMNSASILVSNELIPNRNAVLRQNLAKWGYANHIVTQNEPADFTKAGSIFDVVVIDAPCSGEGLFRKDKEARSEWSLRNVEICASRQSQILEHASALVKPGGILIYSTCTFESVENDLQVQHLNGNFTCLKWKDESIYPEIQRTESGYSFLPHRVKGEGFYISCWRKNDGSETHYNNSKRSFTRLSHDRLKRFIEAPEMALIEVNDTLLLFPENHLPTLQWLREHLFIRKAGIAAGVFKGNDFIPDHELALSDFVSKDLPRYDLDTADALQFLKGNLVAVKTTTTGWALITFKKLPLGWVKVLPNRVNNYYPKNWRILMDVK